MLEAMYRECISFDASHETFFRDSICVYIVVTSLLHCCLKKNQNAPRPSEHTPLLWLFLTFSALVANPKKLLYTVANPARGLLNSIIE